MTDTQNNNIVPIALQNMQSNSPVTQLPVLPQQSDTTLLSSVEPYMWYVIIGVVCVVILYVIYKAYKAFVNPNKSSNSSSSFDLTSIIQRIIGKQSNIVKKIPDSEFA